MTIGPSSWQRAQAAARAAATVPASDRSSRSYANIDRANVFTVFNAILLAFGLLTFMFGEWQDAGTTASCSGSRSS